MTNPAQPLPPQPLTPADERLWASLAFFGNILSFVPSLLIFLIMGPRSPFVRQESREALNGALTILMAWLALAIVGGVLTGIYFALPSSGFDIVLDLLRLVIGLAQWALVIVNLVFAILAGVRVNQGGSYRYPFAVRLVK